MKNLWNALKELKEYKWVELSHSLDNTSPYWDGMPEGVLELGQTVVDFPDMDLWIQTFKFPGQMGTHIDYPGHFIRGAALSERFHVKDTVLPMVVIDLHEECAKNPDYEISVQDILDYEEKYGQIPEEAFVAMRTDWSRKWPDMEAISNEDEQGNPHFPGWPIETIAFLINERKISGIGHETLDTDSAVACTAAGDLRAERYLLGQGKIQVEVLKNLDQVPPAGAVIFIAAPRITGATGLPVRAWAIVPDEEQE